jgi:hypothetical protein
LLPYQVNSYVPLRLVVYQQVKAEQ